VFLLGISQQSLCCFTGGIPNTLVYESLLHVGLTRQKKYLYVGIDKHETASKKDIYRRFKKTTADDPAAEPDITVIRNRIEISKIRETILTEDTSIVLGLIDKNKYLQQLSSCSSKEPIDWGHHVIRRAVLCVNTHKYLSKKIDQNGQQIFAMQSTLVKTELRYVNYGDYSKLRYDLKTAISYNSKTENQQKKGLVVPILAFNEGRNSDYSMFRLAIKSFCESVKAKLKSRNLCFCPIECIIYCHLISMIQHPFEISVGIMDIYTVLYYYRDFYTKVEFDQERHTTTYGCKCHLHFALSRKCTLAPNIKIKNAIVNHYLAVDRIDKIMSSYDETVRLMSNNQHIDYKIDNTLSIGDNIYLKYISSWTGISENKDFIVIAVTCPQLTTMNIIETVVDLFFTYCTQIIDRDTMPTILFTIIHLDSETPLLIKFSDIFSDNANLEMTRQELKRQIKTHYESMHKTIYDFVNYHRNLNRTEGVSEIDHVIKLLKNQVESNPIFKFSLSNTV
jgi:hypothetical protein